MLADPVSVQLAVAFSSQLGKTRFEVDQQP
jgi:hypothetical protein